MTTEHEPKLRAPKEKQGVRLTFSADELLALTRYVSAGAVLLQTSHPVMARLKGALTRLGLEVPPGLPRATYGPRRRRSPQP